DVSSRDRAEQLASARRGAGGQSDRAELDKPGFDLVRVVEIADGTRLLGATDGLYLLLRALSGQDGQPAGEQVIAAVAVLDLDDIAGGAEAVDVSGQDELHSCYPLSRRRGVRKQRDLTGVLHRDGDVALVLAAVAGHPAGADLAAVGDVLPQQRGVLV